MYTLKVGTEKRDFNTIEEMAMAIKAASEDWQTAQEFHYLHNGLPLTTNEYAELDAAIK